MSAKPYIIGIAGGSGSGKTTFLEKLKAKFEDQAVSFINQDDYYKAREEQIVDANGVKNFDLPSCIKIEELLSDVDTLIKGQSVKKIKYTFNNELEEAADFVIKPGKVIIIEGLFVYHYKELNSYYDLRLFIEASDELKILRRIKRDRIERNYPLEDVTYRYEHHVMPAYRAYIEPYKSQADIIINNNKMFDAGLEVVEKFIEAKLA